LKKSKNNSAIISGASTSTGIMFAKLCQREGIDIISVVNDKEDEKLLKQLGIQNIFRIDDPDFNHLLTKISLQLSSKVCFDCLGGDLTSRILTCLPKGSTLYHFGNLEEKDLGKVSTNELIFKEKTIKGWWCYQWLESITKDELAYWLGYIKSEIQTHSGLFEVRIHQTYDLEDADIAISDYTADRAKGKIVITPFGPDFQ